MSMNIHFWTKVMVIGKQKDNRPLRIKVDGTWLEQVSQYCYFGGIITTDGRVESEIRSRVALAKKAFYNYCQCSNKW